MLVETFNTELKENLSRWILVEINDWTQGKQNLFYVVPLKSQMLLWFVESVISPLQGILCRRPTNLMDKTLILNMCLNMACSLFDGFLQTLMRVQSKVHVTFMKD